MDKSIESQLENSGQMMISTASCMVISNQEDYESAGKLLVEIKTRMKQVKDYWQKPKADAKAAHQTLCDREKEMLRPLTEAETIIKKSMVAYNAAVEKARRDAEAAEARRKQEEAERLIQKAVQAETSGNDQEAMINMAMAEMISDMPAQPIVSAPKAAGVSTRKTWKARVADPSVVPSYFNGIEIREINMSKLNNIAKMTDGQARVPGVEFYSETTISSRCAKNS